MAEVGSLHEEVGRLQLGGDALKAAALDALRERVAVVDCDGRILMTNAAWQRFAGRSTSPSHAQTGVGADYLLAVDTAALEESGIGLPGAAGSGIRSVLAGHRPLFQCEYSLRQPGGPAWFLMVVTSLHGVRGPAVITHVDIVSRRVVDPDRSAADLHDPLTGLPGGALLRDRLAMSLAQRAVDDRRTAVFVVGIEDLQVIADDLGDAVVDEVFIEVTRRLQATVRPGDTVARLGPAQLAFVCGAVRGPAGVEAIRMRLRRVLGEPFRIIGHPAPVWIKTTIGAALDGVDGVEPDGLMLAADVARYVKPLQL
ncbi:MAG: GGDEF domain-containing protein [Mycobacteriales bacterium]